MKFLIEPEISGSIKFSQIETGKFVAYLVEEELKSRKKKESYSGTFTPITHYFGYEGRSGHQSEFDCSFASTMGYTVEVIIQHRLTGLAVLVTYITLKKNRDFVMFQ